MKKKAFTLAEVLITLGIIGVVAAMTLPTVIKNHQQKVLQKEFLKAYNITSQALNKTVADFDAIPACYRWASGEKPYPDQICMRWNDKGTSCIGWGMADGGPYPSDWSGPNKECTEFYDRFYKNLKVIKHCTNTEKDGCSAHYKGWDTMLKENNDSLTGQDLLDKTAGDGTLRETTFNKLPSLVLANGVIFIHPKTTVPFIDINGKKGPNKWGYDLYRVRVEGSPRKGLYLTQQSGLTDKGGKQWGQMLESCYKN